MIRLTIQGKMISKDNYKCYNRQGRFFLADKYKQFERGIALQAKAQMVGKKPLEGRIFVGFRFVFPDKRHPDLFNATKSLCDALQGILYLNDKQIASALFLPIEYDKKNPRVELWVRKLK